MMNVLSCTDQISLFDIIESHMFLMRCLRGNKTTHSPVKGVDTYDRDRITSLTIITCAIYNLNYTSICKQSGLISCQEHGHILPQN